MTTPTHAAYRADIDGLRAIAVMAVVGFHAFPAIGRGFVGVDVFFVISGFLITGILLKATAEGRFSLLDFYVRRVKRIFPALFVVLTACLVFGRFALFPDELAALGKHVAAGAGFVSNLALYGEAGYFDTAAAAKPLLHLWSLGIEEQFYFVWPLAIAGLIGRSSRGVWLLAFVLVASFVWNVARVRTDPSGTFYLPMARFWELVIGALLAHLERFRGGAVRCSVRLFAKTAPDLELAAGRCSLLVGWLGLLALLASLVLIKESSVFPGWWALLPTTGAALCIAAGPHAWPNRRLLGNRVLVFVGLLSYPLYLWHWPLLSFAYVIETGAPPRDVRILLVAASMLLAWLTFRFVERPVRLGKGGKWTPRGLAAAVALVGGLGVVVHQAGGFPGKRSAGRVNTDVLTERDTGTWQGSYTACPAPLTPFGKLAICLVSQPMKSPTYAIVGDSHADHLFPGIAERDRGHSWLLAGNGCAPLLRTAIYRTYLKDFCVESNDVLIRTLAGISSLRTVVLSALASLYIADHGFAADHVGNKDSSFWAVTDLDRDSAPVDSRDAKARAYEAGLTRTIEALEAAGKLVVIYLHVPEIPFMPRDCLERPLWKKASVSPCAIERAQVLDRQARYRTMVRAIAAKFPRVRVFDPVDAMCDDHLCPVIRDGTFQYHDSNHLSIAGSRRMAESFLAWFETSSATQ